MSRRTLSFILAIAGIFLAAGLGISWWASGQAATVSNTLYPSQSVNAVTLPATPVPRTLSVHSNGGAPPQVGNALAPITPQPRPNVQATLASTPIPRVVIQAEAPQQMHIDDSDVIRVALLSTTQKTVIQVLHPAEGRELSQLSSPYPVGTPSVPLTKAFGAGYQAYASAQLDASQFTVTPNSPFWQALIEKQLAWNWDVTPKAAGRQVVDLSINVEWRPRKKGKSQQDRQIWVTSLPIQVNVPLLTVGQFNITQFVFQGVSLTSLITMLVSAAAWFYHKPAAPAA